MNTALEYSTRVVQERGRRCKKSILNDLIHLTIGRKVKYSTEVQVPSTFKLSYIKFRYCRLVADQIAFFTLMRKLYSIKF